MNVQSEAITTPSSDLVADTNLWHSTDTESAEIEVTELVAAFVRALQPEFVLETGSAFGQTTLAIAQALIANGHGYLYSLDFNPERVAGVNDRLRQEAFGDYALSVHANGLIWEPPDIQFGFVWLDSDLQTRHQEFDHFRPWMKPGTIVGFHDMGPQFRQWGGGPEQVLSLADEGKIRNIFLPTPRGVAFGEVLG